MAGGTLGQRIRTSAARWMAVTVLTAVFGSTLGVVTTFADGLTSEVATAGAAPTAGLQFHPLSTPCRAVDTRGTGAGRIPGASATSQFGFRSFQIGGTGITGQGGASGGCGVPDGAGAVELSVTVTGAIADGFLRVAPNDGTTPASTFINFRTGVGITNTGTVTLSSAQLADLAVFNFSTAGAHVIVDVQGYYNPLTGLGYNPLSNPCRIVDTRNIDFGRIPGSSAFNPSGSATFQMVGSGIVDQGTTTSGCNVPFDAQAVEISVTVTDALADGFLRIAPASELTPKTTFVNFRAGAGITNTGTVSIGDGVGGELTVFNFSPAGAHVIIDIQGYFNPTAQFGYQPLASPCRSVDTRATAAGRIPGAASPGQPGSRPFQVGGIVVTGQGGASGGCGVPDGVGAVELSVTVTEALADGFLRVAPNDGRTPSTTLVNYRTGVGITNTGTVPLGDDAARDVAAFVFAPAGAHVIVDVQGYFDQLPGRNTETVSVGGSHACVLVDGGQVRCWGGNNAGGLGDGTTDRSIVPTIVGGAAPLANVTQISSGALHTCALLTNGQARCWGANNLGQLGDGTTSNSPLPVTVGGGTPLTGITQITAGSTHSCAVLANGQARCWGANANGQLGDGTRTQRLTPTTVGGVVPTTGVTQITAGGSHTCAVTTDARARCWGSNVSGQLGDGTNQERPSPVTVGAAEPMVGAVQITAGTSHTCGLFRSGVSRCWGSNVSGQLGDFTTTSRSTPVVVGGGEPLGQVTELSAGGSHTCATTTDGVLRCWGANESGQVGGGGGPGPIVDAPFNLAGATGPQDVSQVSAGGTSTCVVQRSTGTARCWGLNTSGQVGDGTTTNRNIATSVLDTRVLTGVQELGSMGSVVGFRTCAVVAGGVESGDEARCWSPDASLAPVPVRDVDGVRPLRGVAHVDPVRSGLCVSLDDGTVRCSGTGVVAGLAASETAANPIPIVGLGSPLTTFVDDVSTGVDHACALLRTRQARCWGVNDNGALGDGTTIDRATPAVVGGNTPLAGVVQISAGVFHTCAVLEDTTARCWGLNASGQLGDGTTTQRNAPVVVGGSTPLSGVVEISAGQVHTCARLADGTVSCWGSNFFGQLGDGGRGSSQTPVGVVGLSGISGISAGAFHSCAVRLSGQALCWGRNLSGELGSGSTEVAQVTEPTFVGGATPTSGLRSVSASGSSTCAVTTADQVRCWGSNTGGQIGDGTDVPRLLPTAVIGPVGSPLIGAR